MLSTDVIVIGGGNAALCAALAAASRGSRVLVVERAPRQYRGGNTRHTRNIRYAHDKPDRFADGAYTEEEFLADLLKITGDTTNRTLCELVVSRSREIVDWLERQGVRWQAPLRGTLHLTHSNRFMLGGGKAMLNAYYDTADAAGVSVLYDTMVEDLIVDGSRVLGAVVAGDSVEEIRARAVIVASGGFEANIDWLKRYWGEAAENFVIRGTPFNDGHLLAAALGHGAVVVGDGREAHAIAVDARAPRVDAGIVTRLDCIPFGVVVNKLGRRFHDEGEDVWPKRYAVWGRFIAQQPDQIAYCLFDSRVEEYFMPGVFPPYEADSLADLADAIGLDPTPLLETVQGFNDAVEDESRLDPQVLDGSCTRGITPRKSNWALRIEKPPFLAYPLRPGITFTYMGLAIDDRARVMTASGPFENLYAAGEIVTGNVLNRGYLAGIGLTIGAVFGRIAGEGAATHARGG